MSCRSMALTISPAIYPLHIHRCSSCGDELVCACPDRRDVERVTGERRKLLCLDCAEMEALLKDFFGSAHKWRNDLGAVNQGRAERGLPALEPEGLPTAEDLDAAAEEQRIREATKGEGEE